MKISIFKLIIKKVDQKSKVFITTNPHSLHILCKDVQEERRERH